MDFWFQKTGGRTCFLISTRPYSLIHIPLVFLHRARRESVRGSGSVSRTVLLCPKTRSWPSPFSSRVDPKLTPRCSLFVHSIFCNPAVLLPTTPWPWKPLPRTRPSWCPPGAACPALTRRPFARRSRTLRPVQEEFATLGHYSVFPFLSYFIPSQELVYCCHECAFCSGTHLTSLRTHTLLSRAPCFIRRNLPPPHARARFVPPYISRKFCPDLFPSSPK